MAVTVFTTFSTRPRPTQDRLAKLYDEDVFPLHGERLARLAALKMTIPPDSQILEFGATTGFLSAEIVHRLDGKSRLLALEPQAPLLERARARVGREQVGRRVFFRQHASDTKLPFPDDNFDVAVLNLATVRPPDLGVSLRDLVRVTKPGGQMIVSALLRGSWEEPLDLFRETLLRMGRTDPLGSLESYVAGQPTPQAIVKSFEAAGASDITQDLLRWELLFRSGREFFYAPVVEHTELPHWKTLLGKGAEAHEVFLAVKDAIDAYFAGRSFVVTLFGGCFCARKPA